MKYSFAALTLLIAGSLFAPESGNKPAFAQVSDQEKSIQRINKFYDDMLPGVCDAPTLALVRETTLTIVREQELPSISEEESLHHVQQLMTCGTKQAILVRLTYRNLVDAIKQEQGYGGVDLAFKAYDRESEFNEDINLALLLYENQANGVKYLKLVDRYDALVNSYNDLGNRLAHATQTPTSVIVKQDPLHCTSSTNSVTHITDTDCR